MAIVKWGFRRFYSSRQALSEISKLVAGSNAQHSQQALSVTSKKPVRGKVGIAARKKMLQSFVDNYRAMNQGKFPSPSSAQKEIGGGYYSLKKMLQEMEFNDKVSSVEKEFVVDQKFEDRALESVSNLDTNFDFKEGLQPSTSNADTGNITRDDTLDIVTECHDRQGQFHEKLEQKMKDESLLGDSFAFKLKQNLIDESLLGEAGPELMSDMPGPQKEVSKAESQHEIPTIKSDIPEQQKDEELTAEQNHEKIQNGMLEAQKIEVSEAEKHHHEIQCLTSDMHNQQTDEAKPENQRDETQNVTSDVPEHQKDEEFKAEQNHEKIQNVMLEQQKIEVLEAEKHHHEIQCITSDMPNQQQDESKPEKQSDETQNILSDLPKQQTDEEIREKLSLWGNLKMLATGLINIWKK